MNRGSYESGTHRTIGPGDLLGPWVIDGVLGRGGMGVVYRVHHASSQQPAALKTLLPGADPQLEARLRREARAISKLRHPGIVRLIEIGSAGDGRFLLALELVEGQTLSALIKERAITPATGALVVAEAARAIQHAHDAKIIHRDIKPANIMVTRDGRAKVLDFGLSKGYGSKNELEEQAITVAGSLLGTIAYMAPEQIDGGDDALTAAADIYGLGATLYETIAFRRAFEGPSAANVIAAVISKMPQPPSAVAAIAGLPPVPRALDAVCLRALAKEPADRHPSAEAFAEDVERALRGGRRIETGRRLAATRRSSGRLAAAGAARRDGGSLDLRSGGGARGGRVAIAVACVALLAAFGAVAAIGLAPDDPAAEPKSGKAATGSPRRPERSTAPSAPDPVARALASARERLVADDAGGAIAAFREVGPPAALEATVAARPGTERADLLAWGAAERAAAGDAASARTLLGRAEDRGASEAVAALARALIACVDLAVEGPPPEARERLDRTDGLDQGVRAALGELVEGRALLAAVIRGEPPEALAIDGVEAADVPSLLKDPARLHELTVGVIERTVTALASCDPALAPRVRAALDRLEAHAVWLWGGAGFRFRFDRDDALVPAALDVSPEACAWGTRARGAGLTAASSEEGASAAGEAFVDIGAPDRFSVIEVRVSNPDRAPLLGIELIGETGEDVRIAALSPGFAQAPDRESLLQTLREGVPGIPAGELLVRITVRAKATELSLHAPGHEHVDVSGATRRVRLYPGRGAAIRELVLMRPVHPAGSDPVRIARGRTTQARTARFESQELVGELPLDVTDAEWGGADRLHVRTRGARITSRVELPEVLEPPGTVLLELVHCSTLSPDGFYAPVTIRVNGRELARDFLPNNSDPRRDVFDIGALVVPGPNEVTIVYSEGSIAHTAYWFYSLTVRY